MMHILAVVLVVVIAIVVLLLAFAAIRPGAFRVERSASVNAPPERLFPLISDFHAWTQWSPWEEIDPALKRSYSGAANGKGAVYEWEGNNKVGKGRMEIVAAAPSQRIEIALHFLKPFKAQNTAEFTLRGSGAATTITWAMTGKSNLMARTMCLFVSMDKMVGGQFEKGLAKLKAVAEG